MNELKDERCPSCGKLLGRIRGLAEIKCPRCSALVAIDNRIKTERQLNATK